MIKDDGIRQSHPAMTRQFHPLDLIYLAVLHSFSHE